MIYSIVALFAGIVGWVVSFLPPGPDIPAAVGDLLNNGVGFVRSLDLLINVEFEIACLLALIVWQVSKSSFRAIEWAYKRVRG